MYVQNRVFVLLVAFGAFSLSGVSTSFHYGNDFIATSEQIYGGSPEENLRNIKLRVAKRYYNEFSMNTSDTIFRRVKRSDEASFVGHPKTREERWHSSFNINKTNLQVDQAQSLVNLLVKVMDRYLNSCIPIVLYDAYVQSSEGIILQTFFKVHILSLINLYQKNNIILKKKKKYSVIRYI